MTRENIHGKIKWSLGRELPRFKKPLLWGFVDFPSEPHTIQISFLGIPKFPIVHIVSSSCTGNWILVFSAFTHKILNGMLYIIWDSELIKTIPPFDSFIALGNFEEEEIDLFILFFRGFFFKIFSSIAEAPFGLQIIRLFLS